MPSGATTNNPHMATGGETGGGTSATVHPTGQSPTPYATAAQGIQTLGVQLQEKGCGGAIEHPRESLGQPPRHFHDILASCDPKIL
jgi:hypothetical protein